MSISPGMIVLPLASITRSTPSVRHAPTHAMRLPRTTIVPRSITVRRSTVMMRALVRAMVPVGTARGAASFMVTVSVLPVVTSCTTCSAPLMYSSTVAFRERGKCPPSRARAVTGICPRGFSMRGSGAPTPPHTMGVT